LFIFAKTSDMKTRITYLFLMLFAVQGMMAQLTSLGLVDESNVQDKKNEIKRGLYFIPEITFVGENMLYAGTPTGLYKCDISNLDAVQWEKLPITDDIIEDFEVRGDTIIVLSRKELLLSVDGGMTAQRRYSDTVFLDDIDYVQRELCNVAVYPGDAKRFYVAHQNSYLSYTDDFGESWTRIEGRGLTDLFYSPHNSNKLVGYRYVAPIWSAGASISTDGGLSWDSARDVTQQHSDMYRIAFHPTDSNRLALCGNGSYALSFDGGASWQGIYRQVGVWEYSVAYLIDVIYDPRNPDTLYGAQLFSDSFKENLDTMKVIRSTDGGLTWNEFFVEPMANKGNLLRMDIKDNLLALYTSANGIYLLDVDAVDTSIPTIENETSAALYYDLQGRPVVNPTRGIYIKDGKKVIIGQ
jgi:hypothetical protein